MLAFVSCLESVRQQKEYFIKNFLPSAFLNTIEGVGMSSPSNQKAWLVLIGLFIGVTASLGTLYLLIPAFSILGVGSLEYTRRWVEYVAAGLAFLVMASIPLIIRQRGWFLQPADQSTKREKTAKELFKHLGKIGLSATLVKYRPCSSNRNIIGAARIAGRSIDLVELDWQEEVRNLGGGYDPETGGTNPDLYVHKSIYRCNYLVQVAVAGFEEKLDTKGWVVKKKGLLHSVVDFNWEGKELAGALNNDYELKNLILSQRSPSNLNIEPNRKGYPYVRINQTRWHYHAKNAFPNPEDFETYNRIAQHIRNITNTR